MVGASPRCLRYSFDLSNLFGLPNCARNGFIKNKPNLISDTLSDDTGLTHHRSKRIANKPRRRHKPKPKNSKPKSDPWGNSGSGATATPPNSTEVEDDFADYPEGYFLKPGMTEAPENYEYSESKFNKPHLTNAEWKDQFTSRKRTYEIEKSKLDSIVPVKPPEAVKGILGDDLLR